MSDKIIQFRKTIIKDLYFSGSLSLSELSIKTDKSIPHVTKILSELKSSGAVVEDRISNTNVGRPAQMYSLKYDLQYIVAVAIDQHVMRIAIFDMNNKLVGKVSTFQIIINKSITALRNIADHILDFIEKSEVPNHKIAGVGIGMPGFIDLNTGINHSYFKDGEGRSIVTFLESILNLTVFIDNDSSLIALAECKFGIAKNRKNVMVINICWGVGLGMILNGSIFHGENGFAGEFSHLPLFSNNKICGCGKMGCLETEASLLVIVQKAIDGIQNGNPTILQGLSIDNLDNTSKKIIDAAIGGDKFSVDLISKAGYNIGRGIAILIHLLNPELIVISGRGSRAGKLWLAPIQQALNEHCIPKIAEGVEIRISNLGYGAELLGAAALVMENFNKTENPKPQKRIKKNISKILIS
ncbi:MAG: ROK family protein [Saprospiraceae bacterium]